VTRRLINKATKTIPGKAWQVYYFYLVKTGFTDVARQEAKKADESLVDLKNLDRKLRFSYTAKTKISPRSIEWIKTCKRYHLYDTHFQMERELGLNPYKFGRLANEKQVQWKKPIPEFIEEIYFKRFGKKQPNVVKSIKQLAQDKRDKKAASKAKSDQPENQGKED
jgi:hypothetical protein